MHQARAALAATGLCAGPNPKRPVCVNRVRCMIGAALLLAFTTGCWTSAGDRICVGEPRACDAQGWCTWRFTPPWATANQFNAQYDAYEGSASIVGASDDNLWMLHTGMSGSVVRQWDGCNWEQRAEFRRGDVEMRMGVNDDVWFFAPGTAPFLARWHQGRLEGWPEPPPGRVFSMRADHGQPVVYSAMADNVLASLLRWDGSTWNALPHAGNPYWASDRMLAYCETAGPCHVVQDGVRAPLDKWPGASWWGGPNDMWMASDGKAWHWDGHNSVDMGAPLPVYAVHSNGRTVVASTGSGVCVWDGDRWEVVEYGPGIFRPGGPAWISPRGFIWVASAAHAMVLSTPR